jgi:dihydroorotase
VHRAHIGPTGVVGSLVLTMSKFLTLGLTIDQVVEKVTAAPARMLRFPDRIGTLTPGAVADVTVLEIEEGTFALLDSMRQTRTGTHRIAVRATIKGGALVAPAAGRAPSPA